MHTMVVRERALKPSRIKGQVYKHVQDLGKVKIEFEKGVFYQFTRSLPSQKNSNVQMFHIIDSPRKREFFLYKARGIIFASFRGTLLLIQYLQTIKIRLLFR